MTINKDNHYLNKAELIRSISKTGNVDLFVACKILDLIYPASKDLQACDDFLDACRDLGLDGVMSTYGR